jgi:hypothetical protein
VVNFLNVNADFHKDFLINLQIIGWVSGINSVSANNSLLIAVYKPEGHTYRSAYFGR